MDTLDRAEPWKERSCLHREKRKETPILPKKYLLWNLRDLLNTLNGNEVAGSTMGVEAFVGRFKKPLSFSLLYNFIRNHKQFIYNQNIPQDSCFVRCVRTLVYLPKASINVLNLSFN